MEPKDRAAEELMEAVLGRAAAKEAEAAPKEAEARELRAVARELRAVADELMEAVLGRAAAKEAEAAAKEAEARELRAVAEGLRAAVDLTPSGPASSRAAEQPMEALVSDAVLSCFVPGDLPPLADGELLTLSKKELFGRLTKDSVLLSDTDRPMSMWLDRETGAKCFMLSARKLSIEYGNDTVHWQWIPGTDSRLKHSRFSECAELLNVSPLIISGKIPSKMLSPNSTYTAYMVFKLASSIKGLDSPKQEASVSVGETKSTRQVCLGLRNHRAVPREENVLIPQKRTDGWMELELGEFFNEGGEDGDVSISLSETKGGDWKKGLIVQGVEIRLKKSGGASRMKHARR